jgi:hypothetical protein
MIRKIFPILFAFPFLDIINFFVLHIMCFLKNNHNYIQKYKDAIVFFCVTL